MEKMPISTNELKRLLEEVCHRNNLTITSLDIAHRMFIRNTTLETVNASNDTEVFEINIIANIYTPKIENKQFSPVLEIPPLTRKEIFKSESADTAIKAA
jgi:hypothetical protein